MAEDLDLGDSFTVPTKYWHALSDGRIQCDVCPRACKLREGQRGVCFVRGRVDDQVVLASYGRSSGFCVDPIEKKPLNHFLPGTSVFSFGTAGCNLACRFCQNWDISKSKQTDTLAESASPTDIAETARQLGCASVAYTYNDPTVFMEYAIDTALACREQGIRSVGVTAGYMNPDPRRDLYSVLDAVNVDLKGFTEDFYRHVAMASLAPVLETLEYLVNETDTWTEVTTLLIPGLNDSEDELHRLSEWFVDRLGPSVPLHFTAFHPDYKMTDVPHTTVDSLRVARSIALEAGIQHVYTGNVFDSEGDTTSCATCGNFVVIRSWYKIVEYELDELGKCGDCGAQLAGIFDGPVGTWGRRRQSVTVLRHR
jgi:pyruvate formate lyase activating enzyme